MNKDNFMGDIPSSPKSKAPLVDEFRLYDMLVKLQTRLDNQEKHIKIWYTRYLTSLDE